MAMAPRPGASREISARIGNAEAEHEAARKLREAADEIRKTPTVLDLRRMQMLAEGCTGQNTATIVMTRPEFLPPQMPARG
jgi:regulator of protease activity HflC (stomatin/prohibitin superfamily)